MADEEKEKNSEYTPLADYLEISLSTVKLKNKEDCIEKLIKTEIRRFKKGYIQFVCDKDEESTMESFRKLITTSLRYVQNGLYVLLKLPQNIKCFEDPQQIINLLINFYQIIENLCFKTHGLSFDSRIIIIHSREMLKTLKENHLSQIPNISECSTDIIFDDDNEISANNNNKQCFDRYKEVVFGGTFDHLHSGHKVLISIAALMCSETLYIGLSIDSLLKNKKHSDMLQSFDERKSKLLEFIDCVKPNLKIVIEALNDLYGPSINEGIECLVISKETIKGAHAVNQKRSELNRSELELVVIDFITSSAAQNIKVSSTEIRGFEQQCQFLYNQWSCLMSQMIPDQAKNKSLFINEWWNVICNFFRQKQRFYHTLNHIEHMIKNCVKHSHNLKNVTVVLLSIWFHDIVYDPTEHNNELLSIRVFEIFCKHLSHLFGNECLVQDVRQKVFDYIDATIRHSINEQYEKENDIKWFLDFDLAILGEEEQIYQKYAQNVRKEYAHIKSPIFEQKRAEVMQKFLSKKQLYFTDDFREKFEKAARRNVSKEIETLLNSVK